MRKFQLLLAGLASVTMLFAMNSTSQAVPIQGANLIMWLDGQDIDGDGVIEGAGESYISGTTATWKDKSVTGTRNATQSTTGTLAPTLAVGSQNGVNTLDFDGSDKMAFPALNLLALPGASIFVVAGQDNTATSQLLSSTTDNQQFRFTNSSNRLEMTGSPNNLGVPQVTGATNPVTLAQAEVTPSSSRVGLKGTFGTPRTHSNTTFSLNQIGARASASDFLNGNMAEVVIYDRVLNSAERIVTENHLNSKYDLDNNGATAIATDRYAGDLNANGDYDFEAFGVGQVDSSNNLTTGSSAGLEISANSGLGDGDFYMAGHKTIINGVAVTDLPSELTGRMERVWFLDKTDGDNSTNLSLTFDFSDAGTTIPTNKLYSLLYSNTNTFESSESPFTILGSPLLAIGDQVTFDFAAASLADGYYTLGFASVPVPEPTSLTLLTCGMLGLILRRRRRS